MSNPVAVVGYGVVGRRVAAALARQPDMRPSGVAVRGPGPAATAAALRAYPVFGSGPEACDALNAAGLPCEGDLADLLATSAAVVDCGPSRSAAGRVDEYRSAGLPAVLGGGEPTELAEATFCASANYADARGRRTVRVASCNVTGLVRLLVPLQRRWGVRSASASLVRCAADPDKADKGVVAGAEIEAGISHHAADVRRILPDLDIHTQAIKVPMTHGHVAMLTIDLEAQPGDDEVRSAYADEPRVALSDRVVDVTGELAKRARRAGYERGDWPEVLLYERSLALHDRRVHMLACIHMESIVVPDTIDCLRAMLAPERSAEWSLAATDRALGLPCPGWA